MEGEQTPCACGHRRIRHFTLVGRKPRREVLVRCSMPGCLCESYRPTRAVIHAR